ncbi:MAG: 30S ribosomal protein S17 [Planctomycetota bacterium]|jgi:small subunit ribosomal protein S17|nr:30S ribosomal protein S17 [Planctomycetota bacterium]
MSETQERNSRKVLQGVCSGAKGDKTITVTVERRFQHPKYRKFIRRHVKVYAHDETNQASEGDIVEVVECRPLSKLKRWRLVGIVSGAVIPLETPTDVAQPTEASGDEA